MRELWIVMRKELIDAFRDRRMVLMAFLVMPLAVPSLLAGMSAVGIRKQLQKLEATLELPVIGAERAPNLMAWLGSHNIRIVAAPEDPDGVVQRQEREAILRISPDYGARWRAGEPARVDLIYDSSRPVQTGTSVARVRSLLEAYSGQVGTLRLIARGVHPSAAEPVQLALHDVATPESRFDLTQQLLPYLLLLLAFIGGMQLAIDATAGERERQSLEPLLATPASRGALISGKILATAVFTLASLLVTLLAYRVAFAVIPVESLDMTLEVSARSLVKLLVVILPIILLGASVLTALAAFARSHREAQGYLPVLIFLPMVPTLFLMVAPVRTQLWMLAVPFLGRTSSSCGCCAARRSRGGSGSSAWAPVSRSLRSSGSLRRACIIASSWRLPPDAQGFGHGMRIGIIGAGLSGLATAFYLSRLLTGSRIVVFEAEPQAGGTLQTVEIDGFRFETGANGFLTNKPDCLQLVRDAGLADRLVRSAPAARRRFIYTDRLHPLPESPPLFFKSDLLTWPEKLRVAGELFVRPRREAGEESLRQFGDRRLGPAFTRVFLDAMAAGIHGSTPDRLSVQAAFPMIAQLEREHGGLLRGMIARRGGSGPGDGLTSLSGGIGMLARRLVELTPADCRLGDPVRSVERQGAGFHIVGSRSTAEVDQVVICAPAFAAAEILAGLDAELAAQLARVEYTPIAVVGLGYRSCPVPLEGFGLLTTSAARVPILGVTWDSSIFPDRAPPGGCALRVMIGGQRAPELVALGERELIETARAGLRATMQLDREPDVTFVQRWPRGIPAYSPGHLAVVDGIFARVARIPGLHLNGNAYRGVAMNDCARESRELALRIATRQ